MSSVIEHFLDKLDSSRVELDKANKRIAEIMDLKQKGYSKKAIDRRIPGPDSVKDFLVDVATARLKCSTRYSKWEFLWLDSYSAMYATPEIVGTYRAGRLRGRKILDIGCGAGLQAVMFSEESDTTGIEVDPIRYRLAKLNRRVYGAINLKLISGRYPEILKGVRIDDGWIIFSDPLRPHISSGASMKDLSPSPLDLVKNFSGKTSNFIFDLPPRMSPGAVPFEGELEYISIDGRVTRLTYYSSSISKSKRRAVLLPRKIVLFGDPAAVQIEKSNQISEAIVVPDPSVVRAELLGKIPGIMEFRLVHMDDRRMVLTGKPPGKDFPGEAYNVVEKSSLSDIVPKLKSLSAGKVFFRFAIQTEEYYRLKNMIERELTGDEEYYIFKDDEQMIITKKLELQ